MRYAMRPNNGFPKRRRRGQNAIAMRQKRVSRLLLLTAQFAVEYNVNFVPFAGLIIVLYAYTVIFQEFVNLVSQTTRQT